MYGKAGGIVQLALAAILSAAIMLLSSGGISYAQSGVYLTYNAGPASFQYPANWVAFPPPQGDLVEYDSPDDVVNVLLESGSGSKSAVQVLQSVLDADAADPANNPDFGVIEPPTNIQIPGASDAAADQYVHAFTNGPEAGTLQDFFTRVALRSDGTYYFLLAVVTDSQLSQYQDQVNQILNSFQYSS